MQYFDARTSLDGGFGAGASPYLTDGGECQSNYVIAMTDGYYNDSDGSISGGNTDGDNNTVYDGGEFSDGYSKTLADIAMEYYENDLKPPAENDKVPTSASDSAGHQHMVTYGVAFGVTGTLDPSVSPNCQGSNPSGCPTWPNPDAGNQQKVDDLWHAAVNGRGKYVSAKSAQELIEALMSLKTNIGERKGTGASASANGPQLSDGSALYVPWYTSENGWRGEVFVYPLSMSGAVGERRPISPVLDAMNWNDRKIFSYDGEKGIAFDYEELTDKQKQLLLNKDTDEAFDESSSQDVRNIVSFLKGDTPGGVVFRNRPGRLGDIIHASPLYRDGILYAGANDGMLHAFDPSATVKNEKFAYIPNLIFDKLKYLKEVNYDQDHQYFVDISPYAKTTNPNADPPTTLLVGGLGKGGKGYYCLDISNAKNEGGFTKENVKWEYPKQPYGGGCTMAPSFDGDGYPCSSDDDMGFSFSRAYIVNSNIGKSSRTDNWVVIFGNGYDSNSGEAVLYILDAETGGEVLFKKIRTNAGNATDQCNGLSTPLLTDTGFLDENGDETGALDDRIDYVYAGDLQGNMWKFDLTAESADGWKVAYGTAAEPKPLFQATDESGKPQPITIKPDAMEHCEKKGYIIVFGTGRYLTLTDPSDNSTQSMYGVWDWAPEWQDKTDLDENQIAQKYLGKRSEMSTYVLQKQEFATDGDNRTLTENELKWFSPPNGVTGENHVGWYIDLPDTGERVIDEILILDGTALVLSMVPLGGGSVCTAGKEYSWINTIDVCTGTKPYTPLIPGIEPSEKKENRVFLPDPIDCIGNCGDGDDDDDDDGPPPGRIFPFPDSDGNIVIETGPGGSSGVIFWRELDH